jgi:hypothetical protein
MQLSRLEMADVETADYQIVEKPFTTVTTEGKKSALRSSRRGLIQGPVWLGS